MGRYIISIVVGSMITISLLFIMQLLIVTGKQALTDPRERHKLEFVRVKRNENLNPDAPKINIAPPQVQSTGDIGGPGGMNIAEGDYLPIVRVAPVYPARALSRGLEGFVDLQFTVTTAGTVRDPLVLQSTSKLFERAAIRAVLKFKYKPRVVDGVPVEVPGVKTRISFMLED